MGARAGLPLAFYGPDVLEITSKPRVLREAFCTIHRGDIKYLLMRPSQSQGSG